MEHSDIPAGHYCYKVVSFNGPKGQIITKTCPYWEKTKNGAKCNLLKIQSENYDTGNLIWDQCKECDINVDDDDEAE